MGRPILLKIVSENRFSGKTYFYTTALPEGHRAERGADEAHAHRPQEPPGIQGRRNLLSLGADDDDPV